MFVTGMKVRYLPQPDWGIGHLVAFDPEEAKAAILFPGRGGEPAIVSTKQKALVHVHLEAGLKVSTLKDEPAEVVSEAAPADGLRRYVVRVGKDSLTLSEAELRAPLPSSDLVTMFTEGRFGDARDYALREQTLKLDDERRCDALGAMLASRVRSRIRLASCSACSARHVLASCSQMKWASEKRSKPAWCSPRCGRRVYASAC